MELTFDCPSCRAIGRLSGVETAEVARCAGCSAEHTIRRTSFDGTNLVQCPWCATEDLYLQKDFPQGLGLAIVVAGFVVSTIFWYQDRPVPALSVLLVSALVNMALFYTVPNVTICYRCLSQFRGSGANPAGRFHAFDLAIGERYRQERLRVEELRGKAEQADSSPRKPA